MFSRITLYECLLIFMLLYKNLQMDTIVVFIFSSFSDMCLAFLQHIINQCYGHKCNHKAPKAAR